jgi:DNA-directed RNA polymerase specialized sigma24 family protein
MSSREPSPEERVIAQEKAQLFFERLASYERSRLEEVLRLRLDGHTNEQIASKLGCALVTVERRFSLIRRIFKKMNDSEFRVIRPDGDS